MQARPVFTNRVDETAAFAAFTSAHREWAATIDPVSPDYPRRNVLDFYGFGGIGKSTLLRRLHNSAGGTDGQPAAALLVDFQEPTSFSAEDLVLRLRVAAGQLGHPCSAFDLALAFYWSIVHPGTPLETYTRNNSALHRASEKIGLTNEMQKVLTEVAATVTSASGMATAGSHLIQLVAKKLREGRRHRHAIENCPILPMFLDPDSAAESLTYMPALLAWDLQQSGGEPFYVFLDTYEEVTGRGRQAERPIQRMCYLLPNVMFVIAGRNRLDWDCAELRGALDFVGPECWPGLRPDAPDSQCILLGELSEADADEYLRERLVIGDGPAIPAPVRDRMVSASDGWPLYLDLAAAYFQELHSYGSYDPDTFETSFPALVLRLMSDLPADERSVVYAAALFESFDAGLVRTAAGNVSDSTVQSVLRRPFVKRDTSAFCPYSLHAALRQVLRDDRAYWSEADWTGAATRAFDEIGRRVQARPGRLQLSNYVHQGLRVSHEFRIGVGWLSEACRTLSRQGGLDAATVAGITGTPAAQLSCLLTLITARTRTPFRSWAAGLAECRQSGLAPADALWARSLEADALLSGGRTEAATALYTEILASPLTPADVAAEARTMYALVLLKTSAFTDLARLATSGPAGTSQCRLLGDVYRSNARWDESAAQFAAGLRQAEAEAHVGLAALFRAELALIDGWTARADPARWADTGDGDHLEPWPRCMHLLAGALSAAADDPASCMRYIAATEQIAADLEMIDVTVDALVVRAFMAAVNNDLEQLSQARTEISRVAAERGEYLHWRDVVAWWSGADADGTDVQWLDGAAEARESWLRTVSARSPRS